MLRCKIPDCRSYFAVWGAPHEMMRPHNRDIRPASWETRGKETPWRATNPASWSTNRARWPAIPLGKAPRCSCGPTNDWCRPARSVCSLVHTRWRRAHTRGGLAHTVCGSTSNHCGRAYTLCGPANTVRRGARGEDAGTRVGDQKGKRAKKGKETLVVDQKGKVGKEGKEVMERQAVGSADPTASCFLACAPGSATIQRCCYVVGRGVGSRGSSDPGTLATGRRG
jgi:hypothetical protein